MEPHILIFSGTTEGNLLAEAFASYPVRQYISVATEYGKVCAKEEPNARILTGRRNRQEIVRLIQELGIGLVIDATHPFADQATREIRGACEDAGTDYLRCLRKEEVFSEKDVAETDSVEEAVSFLAKTEGNILITTGSKELQYYTRIPDYRDRCFARVLSTLDAVEKSVSLGFEGPHLLAMQGPFSKEMNVACIHQTKADWFVTKESGGPGGFQEKLEAARETQARMVIIRRPRESGSTAEDIITYKFPEWMKNREKQEGAR